MSPEDELMASDDHRLIEHALAEGDVEWTSIDRVTDSGEPVFKVTAANGQYFAKLLPEHKGQPMERVLAADLGAGMSPSCMLTTDPHILLMEPAPGRPLSMLLPVCLLPGLWRLTADGLRACLRRVGEGLGELHRATIEGERPPTDEECRMADRLEVASTVANHFDADTVAAIRDRFPDDDGPSLPVALIHGDPTPHNLFWERRSGETTIIDFNLHTSVVLEDVVVVEAGLELMAGRLPYGHHRQARALVDAFRAGYQSAGPQDSVPAEPLRTLKLGYYCHLLDKALRALEPTSIQQRVTRVTDRPVLERRIRTLARGAESERPSGHTGL